MTNESSQEVLGFRAVPFHLHSDSEIPITLDTQMASSWEAHYN